ncbi:hypothetical protein [Mucilaginibacter ginkgonis]|uniref:EcsC family protein n=1 Tax=Mucilaginibacter ginkgonis TaxID=2682091 RepID=A0A6I4HX53_9SPHI|nr:hypothetical protein [Mucilaginibacter ginkgonis]QQL50922.1 hypothetical protein GO620_005560 [Mucilaginibacter ginkgonis]
MKLELPAVKLPKFKYKKAGADLKKAFAKLSEGGFEKIFKQIDQLNIKHGVDTLGIDKFIQQCAVLAAGSGAITGLGGIATMLIGVPVDMINLLTQQFRVTMAISYYYTGKSTFTFSDFIKIVAASLKVDTRMTVSKTLIEEVAEKLMVSIGSKTAERLLPIVGAVIGGTANYLFIKRMADNLHEKYAPVVG